MIDVFGGIFFEASNNLLHPDSLDHVLYEISNTFLRYDPYPTLFQKAAILCWRIITGHIFLDGNKRTGMETCRMFLEINGLQMKIDYVIIIMAVAIAANEVTFEEFVEWLKKRTTLKP